MGKIELFFIGSHYEYVMGGGFDPKRLEVGI